MQIASAPLCFVNLLCITNYADEEDEKIPDTVCRLNR